MIINNLFRLYSLHIALDCLNFINVIFHREVLILMLSDLPVFCSYFLCLVQEIFSYSDFTETYLVYFLFKFCFHTYTLNSPGMYFFYVAMVLNSGYILKPHEELFKKVLLSEPHFRSDQ